MIKSILAIAAAILVAAGPNARAQERMDFKGIPFGSKRADLQRAGKLWCRPDGTKLHDTLCTYENPALRTYAGAFASDMDFQFFDDRLDAVRLTVDYSQYDRVREALSQKYGAPSCDKGPRPECSWRRGGDEATILWTRTTLTVFIESAEGVAERARRLDRSKARDRKDV